MVRSCQEGRGAEDVGGAPDAAELVLVAAGDHGEVGRARACGDEVSTAQHDVTDHVFTRQRVAQGVGFGHGGVIRGKERAQPVKHLPQLLLAGVLHRSLPSHHVAADQVGLRLVQRHTPCLRDHSLLGIGTGRGGPRGHLGR